jgi:ADP-dependent phosphofructokinase/glucokinase
VERVILYKQQVWTCKYTGRKNLSYMSALSSEQKHVERIYFSEFPKYILYPMIKILNESKRIQIQNVDSNEDGEIVNFIYHYFENNFIFGEELFCEIDKNIM